MGSLAFTNVLFLMMVNPPDDTYLLHSLIGWKRETLFIGPITNVDRKTVTVSMEKDWKGTFNTPAINKHVL